MEAHDSTGTQGSTPRMTPPPTQPAGPQEGILKTIMHLRGLSVSEESIFDFEGPEDWRQWPSARYGRDSPHLQFAKGTKAIRNKHASNPTKVIRPTKARKPKTASPPKKKVTEPSKGHGPIPKRDPPVHLLTLPRELRDIIYSLICVSDSPQYPQLRPVFEPGRRGKSCDIRRYPLEPNMSRVNRQLRDEVLSMFYGNNRFVFKSSDLEQLAEYNMIRPALQARWEAGRPAADRLRHIELRVAVSKLPLSTNLTLKLKRLSSGDVSITHSLEDSSHCLCTEEAAIAQTLVEAKGDGNLVQVLQILCTKRRLEVATLLGWDDSEEEHFAMPVSPCKHCSKPRFTEVAA